LNFQNLILLLLLVYFYVKTPQNPDADPLGVAKDPGGDVREEIRRRSNASISEERRRRRKKT
jgi:hypothetical protein